MGTRHDQTPRPSASKQSPMHLRENFHRYCQHLPFALSAFSRCESKRGCAEGHGAGSMFLHQLLREPASEAKRDFPAWADMLSPLSLIAALHRAPVSHNGIWLLPLHRTVSSHSPAPTGLTVFPLQLAARLCLTGSVSPLTSQHCVISFPPPLPSDFLVFIPCPCVLPYAVFCTEVHSTVGLQRRDAKVGCPL